MAYAFRWSQTIGDWDIGFSHFYGTNRDPLFLLDSDRSGNLRIIPFYEMVNQTGLDVQVTKDAWLWKLEAIFRSSKTFNYFASTFGFEYTFFNIYDTGLDIGILSEYLYDSRGRNIQTLFEDDFFVALRFALNDTQSTEILAGIVLDRTTSAKFYNIEASRRFGDSWKLEIEARFLAGIPKNDPAYMLRDDDHVRMELSYHF